MKHHTTRRVFLSAVGASGVTALSGCLSGEFQGGSSNAHDGIQNIADIDVQRTKFNIQEFDWESWPASQRDKCFRAPEEVISAGATFTSDTRDGEGYHPVSMSRDLMTASRCYGLKGEPGGGGSPSEYLQRGERLHRHIVNNSLLRSGALYVPYTAGFRLHGEYGPLKSPWFSGMAQGLLLSAYTRLYYRTDESAYLDVAEQLFRSLQQVRRDDRERKPWVTLVDDDGYYWIEEYPRPDPTHVLNGFNFAIFGLYEYWVILGQNNENRSQVKQVLDAAVTTVRKYLEEWRDPGEVSFYCLKHREKNAKYHRIHHSQMQLLYQITGDEKFDTFAQKLQNDAPIAPDGGS